MSLLLYIEDDAILQIAGRQALQDAGYEVLAGGDGRQAYDHIRARGGEVGTLITDIGLPGEINGWDVAERARIAATNVRVIYVTAADEREFEARGVAGSRLMAKPFEWSQLLRLASELDAAPEPRR